MGAIQSRGLAVAGSKHLFTADFSASSEHGVTTWTGTGGSHVWHGDRAMPCGFGAKSRAKVLIRARALFAPKPGHMTQSPCIKVF
ncbi:MAG: hypothetical protein A2496_01580 [Burkholderiales bacterium RIFOXYC12_FULL_60_6]|nr:MAG: hypothetical protein A2503_02120 [Burkholderiales bacterium RIFOXYD12_FULL_59_19]OGB75970.1 MAG: hypothetical protein A2496_01580 [Burkholderiales bacterium RIFOXYC12_FULL_60_6]